VLALAARQHGVVSRRQLRELGLPHDAIKHRLRTGRLHPVQRGVYAVGRPQLTRFGIWMAAVLGCGHEAALSHRTAGALWEIRPPAPGPIDISVRRAIRGGRGIAVHRRAALVPDDLTEHHGIRVTTPTCTTLDLAAVLPHGATVAAVNEAIKRDLVHPEHLRSRLEQMRGRPGVAVLRKVLDRQTFVLTDSVLERRFLPIARRAGLPTPRTQHHISGFRVDFFWPELGLVVETDGGSYHRTPAQQTADRVRDQAHLSAGLTPLRFTHAQVRFHADHVERTLREVARRLRR
jgi:very-short-patch-repair endonuclease